MVIDFDVTDDIKTLSATDDTANLGTIDDPAVQLESPARLVPMELEDDNVVEFDFGDRSGGGTDDYNDLTNKPSINGVTLIGDKTSEDLGLETVHDLGDFSIEEFDWDFWEFADTQNLTETGYYVAHDTDDDYSYFVRVEKAGAEVFQMYWYGEEGSFFRQIRRGVDYGDGIEWLDFDNEITQNQALDWFAAKNHTHDIEETVNQSNLETYLNGFNLNKAKGLYKIINTRNGSLHYVDYDYRYVSNAWRFYQKWIASDLDVIRVRFGVRSGNSVNWSSWRHYPSEDDIASNYYDMDQIDEMLEDFAPSTMIETTWAELVELRDNAELVPGAYYRITDYTFVTTKTAVHSGGHYFDIVLLAISESMLSENAHAAKNANDTYFEREVTEGGIQWLYTLYVDDMVDVYGDEPMDHADDIHAADEFVDADYMTHPGTNEEVPVLYKTNVDEYSIDDPDYDDAFFYEGTYEFDGDEYDLWSKWEFDGAEWAFMQQYALTPIVVEDGELIVSPHKETKTVPVNMNAWELKYCLDNDSALFDWAVPEGKGVIYYLKDEFGNEASYDFKNVTFRRYQVASVNDSVLNGLVGKYLAQDGYYGITRNNNNLYMYTFVDSAGTGDGSLFGECTFNRIEPYIYLSPKGGNIRGLNDIVLQQAEGNSFGLDCYNITILSSARNNRFETSSLICGRAFNACDFGIATREITFDGCQKGIFQTSAWEIMGLYLDGATFGPASRQIVTGQNTSSTVFGAGCSNIRLASWCYSNSFGNGASNITLGNYCSQISIGKNCANITLTNYYRYITIKDNVTRLNFTTTGGNTSNYVEMVTVEQGVSNVSVAPARRQSYEQVYYKTGRTETAV